MNQRTSPRLDLDLQCRVTNKGRAVAGLTVNISRTGALLEYLGVVDPPCRGDLLTVEVALPGHGGTERRCIHTPARVVRVSQSLYGTTLVAVAFRKLQFGFWPADGDVSK